MQQVNSPQFQAWFKSSHVVDETGSPKIVYHATQRDFDEFRSDEIGSSIDHGTAGSGFYFTDDSDNASIYAKNLHTNTGKSGNENILAVYLRILNPYEGDPFKFTGDDPKQSRKFTDKLRNKGYDGIIAKFGYKPQITWYITFKPNQIKSATGNNGEFSNSNDITK
tara:strand:- start:14786 stop:15283 length:498 start_codon:yes stop_codon:yes gene_type:complete